MGSVLPTNLVPKHQMKVNVQLHIPIAVFLCKVPSIPFGNESQNWFGSDVAEYVPDSAGVYHWSSIIETLRCCGLAVAHSGRGF
jgi:hypothetical protein